MCDVVNGLMYILSTGCQWRAIPKDLPPKSTIYDYFELWTYDHTLNRIHQGSWLTTSARWMRMHGDPSYYVRIRPIYRHQLFGRRRPLA